MSRFDGIKQRVDGISDEQILSLFKKMLSIIPHTEWCEREKGYDRARGSKARCRCSRDELEKEINELFLEEPKI